MKVVNSERLLGAILLFWMSKYLLKIKVMIMGRTPGS